MHHRREGQLMTQTQEEMTLICGFGLFWIGEAEGPDTSGDLTIWQRVWWRGVGGGRER